MEKYTETLFFYVYRGMNLIPNIACLFNLSINNNKPFQGLLPGLVVGNVSIFAMMLTNLPVALRILRNGAFGI